jgi:hypothetical protein
MSVHVLILDHHFWRYGDSCKSQNQLLKWAKVVIYKVIVNDFYCSFFVNKNSVYVNFFMVMFKVTVYLVFDFNYPFDNVPNLWFKIMLLVNLNFFINFYKNYHFCLSSLYFATQIPHKMFQSHC